MPHFSVYDPYANFKFQIKWDRKCVAGFSRVGALKLAKDLVEHRRRGDPSTARKSPVQMKFEPITLERGVTHDTEFEKWANEVWSYGADLGSESSLNDFRKDIIIEVYNEAGQKVIAYNVYRCWVSKFNAFPEINASENAVAIETMTIQNEGWERNYNVVEPQNLPSPNQNDN